jgi:hypothetical protein
MEDIVSKNYLKRLTTMLQTSGTSKAYELSSLDTLTTFGFRGEGAYSRHRLMTQRQTSKFPSPGVSGEYFLPRNIIADIEVSRELVSHSQGMCNFAMHLKKEFNCSGRDYSIQWALNPLAERVTRDRGIYSRRLLQRTHVLIASSEST